MSNSSSLGQVLGAAAIGGIGFLPYTSSGLGVSLALLLRAIAIGLLISAVASRVVRWYLMRRFQRSLSLS